MAHDLHPDFHSSRFALAQGIETVAVQHHHAHVAAVAVEYGLDGPLLGVSLDGFGLGPGNESWGGELLRVDGDGFERLGHLATLKQPGGDAAARQPWRMGAAVLHALGRGGEIAERYSGIKGAAVIAQMLERGVNCPMTSSAGRLFDAACGLLGVKLIADFEGEAPMQLERLVSNPQIQPDGWRLHDGVLDLLPLMDALVFGRGGERRRSVPRNACRRPGPVGRRGGGSAPGSRMSHSAAAVSSTRSCARDWPPSWNAKDLVPRIARAITPGDGAISLGQAWVAGLAKA